MAKYIADFVLVHGGKQIEVELEKPMVEMLQSFPADAEMVCIRQIGDPFWKSLTTGYYLGKAIKREEAQRIPALKEILPSVPYNGDYLCILDATGKLVSPWPGKKILDRSSGKVTDVNQC